jgi:hypothetical protein
VTQCVEKRIPLADSTTSSRRVRRKVAQGNTSRSEGAALGKPHQEPTSPVGAKEACATQFQERLSFAQHPPALQYFFHVSGEGTASPAGRGWRALTREQAAEVLEEILAGGVPEVETAALLAVLATRGEQAPELAGFVDVMRLHSTPMPFTDAERDQLVDCVGTGGGGPQTFNISCGAALVASAAGPASPSTATAPSLRAAALPMCSKPSASPSNSPLSWPSNVCAKPASSSSTRRFITRP